MTLDDLKFEIDGPQIHRHSVDTGSALGLFASYLALLRKVAKEQNQELKFHGLFVEEKCLQLSAVPSDPQVAQMGCRTVSGMLARSQTIPPSLAPEFNSFRKKLAHFPQPISRTSVRVAQWEPIELQPSWAEPPPSEIRDTFSGRATVTRVGGKKPTVRVGIPTEPKEVTLQAEEELAQKIAPFLYKEVEIEAYVTRDVQGVPITGTLIDFQPLSGEDPTRAWENFYRQVASEWDTMSIEEIAKELGRD